MKSYKYCLVLGTGFLSSYFTTDSLAQVYFNPALLERVSTVSESVDLTTFEKKDSQLPGNYRVDIYLNNEKVDTRNVEFRLVNDKEGGSHLEPCLPVADLAGWGVLVNKFPELGEMDSKCAVLSKVPEVRSDFQFSRQQLLLSFPQSSISNAARGWVDPASWDNGIAAVMLNYSLSGANNMPRNGQNSDNLYVNLRPGLNIGPWRLRNYTTWTRFRGNGSEGGASKKWNTVYTYLQRDLRVLRSNLLIGDSTSPADVFDGVPFRGVQLASDDDMLPESLRGYAPTIRGIARSNAQVTIRQNGYVIYQTYVSPGSFEITDMYPTGGSGDLQVTISESDGSEQIIVVPYASLPVLQREGRLKYSLTSATYRSYDNQVEKAPFTQGTAIYGLPAGITIYGGGQFASSYQSMAFGMGKNLGGIGAVSVDMTQAWSTLQGKQRENGRSFRARYSKKIPSSGTSFYIAGYRYATDGFWGLQEVLDTYHESSNSRTTQERKRNRAEITMTQTLGDNFGNLAITAVREDYWNTQKRVESYGVGYSNSWKGVSYGLNYTYSLNSGTMAHSNGRQVYEKDQLFSFNISVPLARLFSHNNRNPIYVSYTHNSSKNGSTTNNVSASGAALSDNNLNWSIQQGYTSRGQGNSGNANIGWRTAYGEVTSGYGYDAFNRRLNYGLKGGMVVHEDGITLGQSLGDTIALVSAPEVKGAMVQGQTGVKTDYRGYAIVPYATPYRKNSITLDTETLGDDVEVMLTTQTVVPSRGAVVKATYQTSVGYRALLVLTRPGGQVVPFGTIVSNPEAKGSQGAIVGDEGQVYLTGLEESGRLLAKWGDGAGQQCQGSYKLSEKSGTSGVQTLRVNCT